MPVSTPSVHPLSNLQHLEQLFSCLPPLTKLFETWGDTGTTHISPMLMFREQLLGAATLPGASLQLLYDVASAHLHPFQADKHTAYREQRPLYQRLVQHVATYSALETQAVLPPGVLVQKTITVEIDGKWILCSRVGAQPITRKQLQSLVAQLALSRRATKRCTLNPATCYPVKEFEMLPGMVSPFLRPQRSTRMIALAFLPWPKHWEKQGYEVAISLSLLESVLLPLHCLKTVLFTYVRHAYPDLPVIELQPPAHENCEEQKGSWDQQFFTGVQS